MSKYNNKKTIMDGITFDSQHEASYYRQLTLLQRAGVIKQFELQPVYELQPGYKRGKKKIQPITYKADFLVTYSDGRQEIIDCKGMRTPTYILKKKMFEYKYPELEIKEVPA